MQLSKPCIFQTILSGLFKAEYIVYLWIVCGCLTITLYGWTMSDGMLIVCGCLTITLYGWTMSDGMVIVCGCLTITLYGWTMSDGIHVYI